MIKQRNITLIVVHCTASRCTSNLTPEALDSTHKNKALKSFSASCCSPTGEQRFAVTVTSRPTSTTTEP